MRFFSISISTSSFSSSSDKVLSRSDYSEDNRVSNQRTVAYLELVFDFGELFRENCGFLATGIDFFLQDLRATLEYLHLAGLAHIADVVAFVFKDDALGTDVGLLVLAEELGSFVGVFGAVLFGRLRLLLHLLLLLLRGNDLLGVQVVEDGEVLDELLDVGTEVTAAGGTGQDVARAQVHQTVLAESVATSQDPWNLLLVVVLVEANRAGDLHGDCDWQGWFG